MQRKVKLTELYPRVRGSRKHTRKAFGVSVMRLGATICRILVSDLVSAFDKRLEDRKGAELMRNDERIMITRIAK